MCDEQTMTQATPSWSFSKTPPISHLRPISARHAGEGSTEMPCLTIATPLPGRPGPRSEGLAGEGAEY